MEAALPFVVFAAFLLLFFVRARREGVPVREWLADRNARRSYTPGWWKPMAVLLPVLFVLFIVVATAQHGFRWAYLLVVPILGGFFAAAAVLLSWLLRRQQ